MRNRFLTATVAVFTLIAIYPQSEARADVLLQTANLGGATAASGATISTSYLGARFQITQAYTLTSVQIRARVVTGGNGLLFAAIVPLTSLTDFPDAFPAGTISDDNPREVQTFTATSDYSVITIPFSSTLTTGIYGLVFGSNEFGATGTGQAADNNPNIGTPSYFVKRVDDVWVQNNINNVYFVVNGNTVASPEPTTVTLLGLGAAVTFGLFRRRRMPNALSRRSCPHHSSARP